MTAAIVDVKFRCKVICHLSLPSNVELGLRNAHLGGEVLDDFSVGDRDLLTF